MVALAATLTPLLDRDQPAPGPVREVHLQREAAALLYLSRARYVPKSWRGCASLIIVLSYAAPLPLLPTSTYRTKAFIDAALKLGLDVVAASEQPSTMAAKNPAGLLTLNFLEPEKAGREAAEFAHQFPMMPSSLSMKILRSSPLQSLARSSLNTTRKNRCAGKE